MRWKLVLWMAALVIMANTCQATDQAVGPYLQQVSVNVYCPAKYGGSGAVQGSGSIFLSKVEDKPTAWILTAHHVVEDLRDVKTVIGSDGDEKKAVRYRDAQIIQEQVESGRAVGEIKFDARIISVDARRDIALLRVRKGDFSEVGAKFYLDENIPIAGTAIYHCLLPGTQVQGGFVGGAKSFYRGQAVEIITRSGAKLRVTKNHPILTKNGFVCAGSLKQGDKLCRSIGQAEGIVNFGGPCTRASQIYDKPTPIEQVFNALARMGRSETCRRISGDFHGDGHFIQGNIQTVGSYRALATSRKASVPDNLEDSRFKSVSAWPLIRVVGFRRDSATFCGRKPPPRRPRTRRAISQCYISFLQNSPASAPANSEVFGERLDAHAVPIGFNQLCGLSRQHSRVASITDRNTGLPQMRGYRRAAYAGPPLDFSQTEAGFIGRNASQSRCLSDLVAMGGRLAWPPVNVHATFAEPFSDGSSIMAQLSGNSIDGKTRLIELDDIVNLRRFQWSGHVYDLQSGTGLIIAESLVTSNCGAPGGKEIGGTCSLTSGIISRIGVRIPEFGGGSEHGVFDQTDTAALGGSSGGLIALKADGRWIGMITLGLQAGDNFHWLVPARSVRAWAKEIKVEWLFDPGKPRPTEEQIRKIPLENVSPGFGAREPKPKVPTPARTQMIER